MNEEMKSTNTPVEEKKDNKKKAIIAVLALLIAGCAVGLPLYMNGTKEDAEQLASVTLEEQEVPLAASVEEAEEPEVEEKEIVVEEAQTAIEEADDEDTNTGNTRATGNEVLGERRIITDANELAAEAEVLGAFLETLPTAAEPAAMTTVVDTTDIDAEAAAQREAAIWQQNLDTAREAARLQQEAEAKAARVAALEAKIAALKADLSNLKGNSRQAATIAAELADATTEFKDAVDEANEALNEAKEAAVEAANVAGAGMEAIQELLSDKTSVIYKYFNTYPRKNANADLDSTGKNWALGETDKAGDGVNTQIVEKVEELDGKLPTETSDDELKEAPKVAYNVNQQVDVSSKANPKYSIIWAADFASVEVGQQVEVYYLDAEGNLFTGTVEKKADTQFTEGGEMAETVENMQQVVVPEGEESALTYLQGLTAENYDAQVIAYDDAVEEAAKEVEKVVNNELQATIEALAAEQNRTVEEVAADYQDEMPAVEENPSNEEEPEDPGYIEPEGPVIVPEEPEEPKVPEESAI